MADSDVKLIISADGTRAIKVSQEITNAYKTLATTSIAEINKKKSEITAAYETIKKSGVASAKEIERAEKAKNAAITRANNDLLGKHTGMLSKLGSGFSSFGSALAGLGAGISIAGIYKLIRGTTEAAESMELLMQKTGASYETLKVFGYMAKLTGMDMEGVSKSMGILAKNMQGAAVDMGGASKSLAALGISVKDSSGRLKSMDQIIPEIADKFQKMADGTGKTAYAMAIFGKSGKDMIPILNQGSEGIRETREEMEKLGFRFDEVSMKQAAALNESFEKLDMVFGNVASRVAMQVVPGLLNMSEVFIENIKDGGALAPVIDSLGFALKGLVAVGVGVVASFDLVGTAIGQAAAKYGKYALLMATPITAPVGIYKIIKEIQNPAGVDILGGLKAKAEGYGAMIQGLMNKDYVGKSPRKKTTPYDAPLLAGKDEKDKYAETLRAITDETTAWMNRVAEMNPQLEKQDSEILKLTNDAETLIKKIQDQADKAGIDTAPFIAKVRAGLAQGIEYATEKEMKKLYEDYQKLLSDEIDYGRTENERYANQVIHKEEEKIDKLAEIWARGAITEEEFRELEVKIHANAAAAILDKETENAKKIADINYNLIQNISGMQTWAHKLRLEQIEAQGAAYLKDGADPRAVEAWKADQRLRANIVKGIKGNDFTEGYKAQLEQYKLDMKTAGEYGAQVFQAQGDAIKDSLGGALKDLRKGELKDFTEYFKNFGDKLLTVWEDMLAEMLANWIMTGNAMKTAGMGGGSESSGGLMSLFGGIAGLFGLGGGVTGTGASVAGYSTGFGDWTAGLGFHGGGIPGVDAPLFTRPVDPSIFFNAPRYHTGIGPGERAAIITDEEGVFTPGQMKALGAHMGNTYQINVPVNVDGDPRLANRIRIAVEEAVQRELGRAT